MRARLREQEEQRAAQGPSRVAPERASASISSLRDSLGFEDGVRMGAKPREPKSERERVTGLRPFQIRKELRSRGLSEDGSREEMIERLLEAPAPSTEASTEAQEVAGAKAAKQQAAAAASKERREEKAAAKAAEAGPESIDERIAREKREKYEASDEYKQLMQKKSEERANIELSDKNQLSEKDLEQGRAATQEHSESRVKEWISAVTGTELEGALEAELRSGVVLCALANKIQPGKIDKVSSSSMPFPQRENIKKFIDAARDFGVLDRENFDTVDLFPSLDDAPTNMKQVLICLNALGRECVSVDSFDGPYLAAKDGSANRPAQALSGKVGSLAVSLKDKIGMGKPPPEPGTLEFMEWDASGLSWEEWSEQLDKKKPAADQVAGVDRGGKLTEE